MSEDRSTQGTNPMVGASLASLHEGWLDRAASFLADARGEDADLRSSLAGDRWPGDQLGLHFLLEVAFVESLEGRLTPDRTRRLAALRASLERSSTELRHLGRTPDRRDAVGLIGRRFLRELAGWCIELELATAQLPRSELPASARSLLAGLEAAARWPAPVGFRRPRAAPLSA